MADGIEQLEDSLDNIAECADNINLVPIAQRALGLFTRRAFDEGKNVDGSVRTKGANKSGESPYTSAYAKRKAKEKNWNNEGYVDLMYEGLTSGGGMRGNIGLREQTDSYIDIGFSRQEEADKLTYNEDRYGIVRGLTEENNKIVVELYNDELIACLESKGFNRTG